MPGGRRSQRLSVGAPSGARDHIYWFGSRGCIFTSPCFRAGETTRQAAVLLLTVSREQIEVTAPGQIIRHDAVCVAPMCRRQLHAVDVGLVSVNIHLHHPGFRAFCTIPEPGVIEMDRAAFTRFDDRLIEAYEGRMSRSAAADLFEDLVHTAVEQLPLPERCDPRAEFLRDLMRSRPACTLADMADALGVGYTTASHLFSKAMGVSLRSYQLWSKAVRAAARMEVGARLTDIAHEVGFVDSAHLSRTWRRTYGFAPSYITDGMRVQIH